MGFGKMVIPPRRPCACNLFASLHSLFLIPLHFIPLCSIPLRCISSAAHSFASHVSAPHARVNLLPSAPFAVTRPSKPIPSCQQPGTFPSHLPLPLPRAARPRNWYQSIIFLRNWYHDTLEISYYYFCNRFPEIEIGILRTGQIEEDIKKVFCLYDRTGFVMEMKEKNCRNFEEASRQ